MTCHVCSRSPNSRLSFYCSTCARNQLYQLRIEHAGALLEKETAGRHIGTAVASKRANADVPVNCGTSGQDENYPTRWTVQAAQSRSAQSRVRTHTILKHVEILKGNVKEGKDEIAR